MNPQKSKWQAAQSFVTVFPNSGDLLKENNNMFKSLFSRIAAASVMAALAILMITATAGAASSTQLDRSQSGVTYTFKTLNNAADPTFNQLLGINNHGVIAGYFGSGATGHPNKGYTLSKPYGQGNYTNENFPGSVQTQVTAINNQGDTAGSWCRRIAKRRGDPGY